MKIEIKLKTDQLAFIVELLEICQNMPHGRLSQAKRETRVVMSIMFEISNMFLAKFQKLQREQKIFDSEKKHKFTLLYHQAHALSTVINGNRLNQIDPYKRAMSEIIYNNLEK